MKGIYSSHIDYPIPPTSDTGDKSIITFEFLCNWNTFVSEHPRFFIRNILFSEKYEDYKASRGVTGIWRDVVGYAPCSKNSEVKNYLLTVFVPENKLIAFC